MPSPDLFFDTASGYVRTEVLRTAVELDLFSAIAAGRQTVPELARHCESAEKGIRVLCDYLVVAGFLLKQQGRYMLTPDSATFLDRKSPAYLGGVLTFLHTPTLRQGYANLTAAVRKGGTAVSADGLMKVENTDWVQFARSMVPMMAMPAQLTAQLIDRPADAKLKVLDIAAGHGLFGIEVARRFAEAQVTGLDWPNVLEVAKENARRCGELLRKVHRALEPDGIALAVEFIPDEERVSPPFPAMFALAMLVATAQGEAYTWSQLDAMFKGAGFSRNTMHALPPSAEHAVVARK
jgi:hypothetical protein